jgi:tetratricopeptide (TPR) repeat protein
VSQPRRLLACLVASALLASASAAQDPVDLAPLRERLDTIRTLQASEQPAEAQRLLELTLADLQPFLEADAPPSEALVLAAQAHLGLEQDEEARALLDRALEIEPGNDEAVHYLGLLALFDGDVEAAIARFRQAAAARPEKASHWAFLADALAVAGRPEEALVAYREVLELDPKDARALVAVARHDLDEGESEAALAGFRKAAEIEPTHWEAAHQAGVLLEMAGQPEEALPYFEQAVRNDRTDWRTLARLVRLHEQHKRPEAAEAARARLLDLRAASADPVLARVPSFTRDEFQTPAGPMQALEHFPAPGETPTRFTFRLEDGEGRILRTFLVVERLRGDEFLGADLTSVDGASRDVLFSWQESPSYTDAKARLLEHVAPR